MLCYAHIAAHAFHAEMERDQASVCHFSFSVGFFAPLRLSGIFADLAPARKRMRLTLAEAERRD